MMQHVYYLPDGESGRLVPVWLMLTCFEESRSDTLVLRLEAPFVRMTEEQLGEDGELALTVPDSAYVRLPEDPSAVGIRLPALRTYAASIAAAADTPFEWSDIKRLILRVSDIEEALQYEVDWTRLNRTIPKRVR